MTQCDSNFSWHRPNDMPMSVFKAFTSEVEASVGTDRPELLAEIDRAMNDAEKRPGVLELTKEVATACATASGIPVERYLRYLAFLDEIERRKETGPALWERNSGVVPCPDFLIPTSGQVPMSRMGVYKVFTKIWNILLIVVVGGILPLMLVPLCSIMFTKCRRTWAVCMICTWLVSLTVFLLFFISSRMIKNSARKSNP